MSITTHFTATMRFASALTKLTPALLGVVALFGIVLALPTTTQAETVTLIPPRLEMRANPGDTVREFLRVRNDSDTDIQYSTEVEDFRARGDEGDIDFVNDGEEASSFRMARWVTVEPSRFTIPRGEEVRLEVIVRVPRNAEPGGHFASVLVRRGAGPVAGGASVESRVGSLMLMTVSGNVTEKAKLDLFRAQQGFYQNLPTTLEMRTVNEGNVHVQPKGTITVTDMFGRKVAELPLTPANVLPGAARISRTTWDTSGFHVGRYTATVVAEYGQNSNDNTPRTFTASTSFIVFPLWLLWILLGIIAAVGSLFLFRKQIRKFINRLTAD